MSQGIGGLASPSPSVEVAAVETELPVPEVPLFEENAYESASSPSSTSSSSSSSDEEEEAIEISGSSEEATAKNRFWSGFCVLEDEGEEDEGTAAGLDSCSSGKDGEIVDDEEVDEIVCE